MHRFSRLLAGLALLFVSVAFVSGSSGLTALSIKNGIFKANTAVVNDDWQMSDVVAALGTAERIRDGYNRTHTYDNCGVVLFEEFLEEKGTGRLKEFQVYFSQPEKNDVTPNGYYTGSAKVDKLSVSKNLTPKVMKKKLKGWSETDSYIEHSFRMANKGVYIYFQFNESETGLIKMSVGPDKKK
jgi:hypothetical protein